MKLFVSVTSLATIFFLIFWVTQTVSKDLVQCAAEADCETLEAQRMSTQESDPFLFGGRLVDANHPRWRFYKRAIKRFPDTRSCLKKETQTSEAPNLFLIDWKKVGTGRAFEVCAFRIFRSIDSLEGIESWLRFHDFQVGKLTRFIGNSSKPRFSTDPVELVTAWWTTEQYRRKNPSLFVKLIGFEFVLNYSVVVQFDQSGQVVVVGASSNSK